MATLEELHIEGLSTPAARWARFGPYYAMFPLEFAFEVVNTYSNAGDSILDPFAGRCSSVYAGAVLGRYSRGIEINPVGWIYGKVKLKPANKDAVISRLEQVYTQRTQYTNSIKKLPEFFHYCFCKEVLAFLLAVRENLDWKVNEVDVTLMAFILVYLHGKLGEGLSNQMRQTKSMGPEYSVNWWKEHNLSMPPQINPYDFMLKKIQWRYQKGIPNMAESAVLFGDSTTELDMVAQTAEQKFSLLFTSPPYWSIADYHTDQWLRLWLLGGNDRPKSTGQKHKRRFNSKVAYQALLETVFSKCAKMMAEHSTIYVRTDAREFTFNCTLEMLKKCFPGYKIETKEKPFKKKTQTALFGNTSKKPAEIDIILQK